MRAARPRWPAIDGRPAGHQWPTRWPADPARPSAVLAHALVSFVYNTMIVALALNRVLTPLDARAVDPSGYPGLKAGAAGAARRGRSKPALAGRLPLGGRRRQASVHGVRARIRGDLPVRRAHHDD